LIILCFSAQVDLQVLLSKNASKIEKINQSAKVPFLFYGNNDSLLNYWKNSNNTLLFIDTQLLIWKNS